MPRLMILWGARPAISLPSNRIDPALGRNVPDSMLKIVLLPEPFGPIRPRISPLSTLKDTSLTAVNPPKRLINPLTTSTAARSSSKRVLLLRVGRACWELQNSFALRLALRPDHVRLVVDVLRDHRGVAQVLSGHGRIIACELHAEAQHRAALRQIDLER